MKTGFPYIWLAAKIIFFRHNPTIQKFSVATAILAIGVGVASLAVTIGVLDGFHREIKGRILGLSPHIFIRMQSPSAQAARAEIQTIASALSGIDGLRASPFAMGQAMIRAPGATLGIVVKAIDPELERQVTLLDRSLKKGNWLPRSAPSISGKPKTPIPVLLGTELARNLGVWVESTAALLSSSGSGLFSEMPRIAHASVSGIFESGYYEYDSSIAYIPFDRADELWRSPDGTVNAIFWYGIIGPDPEKSPGLAKAIKKRLQERGLTRQVLTWSDMNKNLFSALKLEKLMLTLVLSLIIFVASITVTSNLIMIAAQKTRMIGSLRSMGTTRREVARLMLAVGSLLGFLGVGTGLLLTLPVIGLIKHTNLIRLPAEIYMIDKLPVHLTAAGVIGVSLFAWLMSVAASAIPAYRTSRLETSEILRYG